MKGMKIVIEKIDMTTMKVMTEITEMKMIDDLGILEEDTPPRKGDLWHMKSVFSIIISASLGF